MRIEHSDEDTLEFMDAAAMSYMAVVVHKLNSTLIEKGIKEVSQRREICTSFLFDFAYNDDAGWLSHGDQTLFPKVCFAERAAPAQDENLGGIETLHVSTGASSWHEYAIGVVDQYFDEDRESIAGFRTGSYSDEDTE